MKFWLSLLSAGCFYVMALAAFHPQGKRERFEEHSDGIPTRRLVRCQCGCDEFFDLN